MNLRHRLIQFIESQKITKSAFEKKCGLSNGFVDNCSDNTRQTSLNRISEIFPELNILWLRTGYGEMLYKPEVIQMTKGCNIKNFISRRKERVELIPLLPISLQNTSLDKFLISVTDEMCEMVVSPINNIDFAMTVNGESMQPEYPSGAQILVRKIDEASFIDWGNTYVLDTRNGIITKKIMPGSDTQKIKCVSINPEYPPFEVSLSDVSGIYRVVMCMIMK